MDPTLHITSKAFDNVVEINVPEGKDKPYQVGGEFFIRQGASSQVALEVKFKDILRSSDYKGLSLFSETYSSERFLINMSKQDETHRFPFNLTEL